jgi:hypothetical protein
MPTVKLHTLLPILLAAALGTGCATRPAPPVPVTQLVLNQPISVPEGRARVYLQDGAVVGGIDEFRPHCALEIRQVSGPPRTVPAGVYPVTRVQDVTTPIVLAAPGRQLAGVGFGVGIGSGALSVSNREDGYADIFEGYHFWLADSAGVGLMRLTCLGARAQPVDVAPPTRAEMAQALGKLGRLEP